jgi:bifunctional DNA-binding transcriptional regulator/antitoxin component of YhaV-PrlF toxin-antitoxin module
MDIAVMSEQFTIKVNEDGSIHLPPEIRRRYGVVDGAELTLEATPDGLRLQTPRRDSSAGLGYPSWRDISHQVMIEKVA